MHTYPIPALERAMKIQEVILKAMSGQIHWFQAAEILGVSPRQMRRWKNRYEYYGYDGLFDRRKRRPSPRRMPIDLAEKILHLYREKYFDFNVSHFCEKLLTEHKIKISYNWVRLALQGAGLVLKKTHKEFHRKKRERKPLPGMMLHMDGSPHDWLGNGTQYDLVTISDDATNEIYDLALVQEEDAASCMQLIKNVVERKGIFCSLYTDRASHFFLTKKAGHSVEKDHQTQLGRALNELGIQQIAAYSPQARGRSERLNETLQGRLPQELRLKGIKTSAQANHYLKSVYRKEHNKRFITKAQLPGSAFVALPKTTDLNRVFGFKYERVVNNDNTVSFNNRLFQISPTDQRVSYAKCRVSVLEHLDGSVTIAFGPHTLGYYSPKALACPRNRLLHTETKKTHNKKADTSLVK